jgi:hypothetical protein
MSITIPVSKHLSIELLPGTDDSDPALRLFTNEDPERSFVVFLSEVHLLRDSLGAAGARLAEIELEARRRRNFAD